MNKSYLFLTIFTILFSYQGWSQKNHKHMNHNHHFSHNTNLSFTGGVIAGLLLNEFTTNHRQMYFRYNYHKNKWRLQKDFDNNLGFNFTRQRVTARFENPNGGKDFILKINKHGHWFIDAPKRFRNMLKNKLRKHL